MKTLLARVIVSIIFLLAIISAAYSQSPTNEKYLEGTISQYISCADETASGNVTLRVLECYNSNGKIYKLQIKPVNVKLVGEKTGIVYNAVGVTESKETFFADGEMKTSIDINNFHLVGVGKEGVNYRVHWNIGFAQNANGEVTADFEHASLTCE